MNPKAKAAAPPPVSTASALSHFCTGHDSRRPVLRLCIIVGCILGVGLGAGAVSYATARREEVRAVATAFATTCQDQTRALQSSIDNAAAGEEGEHCGSE